MRETIDKRDINGFKCTLEFDTGGPVGSNNLITIRKQNEDFFIGRWFYFDEQVENYMWNFANKVSTDEEYREKSLSGDADWSRVSNLYEPLERRLYGVLKRSDKTEFPIIDDESRKHSDALKSQCEELFNEIREVVREDVDKHPDKIFEDKKQNLTDKLERQVQ